MSDQSDFNPNNTQQLQERIEALKASKGGSLVEMLTPEGRWVPCPRPGFSIDIRYRATPQPKVVWWNKPEHVPFPCEIQTIDGTRWTVEKVTKTGFGGNGQGITWATLERMNCKYRTDNGEFKFCTVLEMDVS